MGDVCSDQAEPLVERQIKPPFPTATNAPLANVTPSRLLVVPDAAADQALPLLDTSTTPDCPTLTNTPLP